MLDFGKSNHDRLFKQRRLYLAITVHINTWQLMLDFDRKEQYPVIILIVDYILHLKQTIYKFVQYYQVIHPPAHEMQTTLVGDAVNYGHTHGSFSMHKHSAQLVYRALLYRKRRKIRWAKLSHFSQFLRVLRKFSCEYKCLSLIILNKKHFWPRQHKCISMNTSMELKPRTYSPANLSLSTVVVFFYLWMKFLKVITTNCNQCHKKM